MYVSRYIGVNEKEDVQFFYYFIESEGNPTEDPLMLWTSGSLVALAALLSLDLILR